MVLSAPSLKQRNRRGLLHRNIPPPSGTKTSPRRVRAQRDSGPKGSFRIKPTKLVPSNHVSNARFRVHTLTEGIRSESVRSGVGFQKGKLPVLVLDRQHSRGTTWRRSCSQEGFELKYPYTAESQHVYSINVLDWLYFT